MKNASLSLVLACLMVSAAAGQTPIPGYPGLTEEDLQALIDEASSATGVGDALFCVKLSRASSAVPGAARCRPDSPSESCPGQHRIALYPNTMADSYEVPLAQRGDYSWMTGDYSGNVLTTLMHEMLHACSNAGGTPCQQNEDQYLCEEIFIDINLADELCGLITGLDDMLCKIIAGGPTGDELEAALALMRKIQGLCSSYELLRTMYNSEAMVEWWCACQNPAYGLQWPPAAPKLFLAHHAPGSAWRRGQPQRSLRL